MKQFLFPLAGALLGLLSATLATADRAEPRAEVTGPWHPLASATDEDENPYVIAHYLMAGRLLPAQNEDEAYEATTDGEGRRLDAACSYALDGQPPDASWWQVSAAGDAMPDPQARPAAIASPSLIREADGRFRISVSRSAMPGNWIAPPTDHPFRLALALHRTQAPGTPPPKIVLPSIARLSCG